MSGGGPAHFDATYLLGTELVEACCQEQHVRGTVWWLTTPILCGLLLAVDAQVTPGKMTSPGRAEDRIRQRLPLAIALDPEPHALALGTSRRVRSDGADSTPVRATPLPVSRGDLEILARIVKGECPPGTPFEGRVAVAAVVLNRVRCPRFPDSIPEVAHQPAQFSCFNPNNRARLYAGPIPPVAWNAARVALAGSDPTHGCMFFFNPFIVHPGWAGRLEFVRRIGTRSGDTHDFYRYKSAPGP